MKLISHTEFLKMPSGTLFSLYEPSIFSGLFIKAQSLDNDFVEMDLIGNLEASRSDEYFEILDKAEDDGCSFKLDFENYGRNGLFNEDQVYAIYEKEDVECFIKTLSEL